MFLANPCMRSDALPVESSLVAASEDFQRAGLSHRIGPDEDPVLPGGEPAENACFQRLARPESQARFHSRQRVRGETGALLDGEADLTVPVERIRRRCNEPKTRGFFRTQPPPACIPNLPHAVPTTIH